MVSKDLKIEIRPIPNRQDIKQFSENLEFFSQAHSIHAFVNPVTRKYSTGLSQEDIDYIKSENFPYDISDTFMRGKSHEFWESAMMKMELLNTPIFLFPGKNIIDFIKYKYLLVNNYIYASEEELKTGSKSEATHYIYNESEENSIKSNKIEQRNILIAKLTNLSLARKRQLVLIILDENTENKTEDYLTIKLDNIINNKDLSNELIRLLEESVEDVTLVADIKSAIHKGVLRKTKQGIFFFESNLGFDETDVKKFLADTANQEILLNIKSKIQ